MVDLEQLIKEKLQALNPLRLEIINESYKHAGHQDGIAKNFKILIVSDAFQDVLPVQRHKKVYELLKEELKSSLHALALKTLTPQEYETLTKP